MSPPICNYRTAGGGHSVKTPMSPPICNYRTAGGQCFKTPMSPPICNYRTAGGGTALRPPCVAPYTNMALRWGEGGTDLGPPPPMCNYRAA